MKKKKILLNVRGPTCGGFCSTSSKFYMEGVLRMYFCQEGVDEFSITSPNIDTKVGRRGDLLCLSSYSI